MADKYQDSPPLPPPTEQLDPASQSLADALNLSFRILKVIMVFMVFLFLGSGIFTVEKDEEAIVLRFGKVVGTKADRILKPGLHWALPFPLSEVVKVPKSSQKLLIENFWYYQPEEEKRKFGFLSKSVPKTLDPEKDGYLITGDNNLVHFIWQVEYRIVEPYYYTMFHDDPEELLYNIIANIVVEKAANFSVSEVLFDKTDELRKKVKLAAQQQLDRLQAGLQIINVKTPQYTPPRQVKEAFESVSQAASEKSQKIAAANSYHTQVLNKAKGEKARIIDQARNYALKVEKDAEGDASYFRQLVKQYQANPEIFYQRHYQRLMEKLPEKVREIFVLSSRAARRDFRIQLNRDPSLERLKPAEEEQ